MNLKENYNLCVDLDGTLINSDLLLETFLLLLKRNLLYIFIIPFWLIRGKAAFKAELAKRVQLNPSALPYNKEFVEWLIEQKGNGKKLWLCTASNYRLANSISQHLNIFSGVIASDDSHNMSGSEKAKALVERFGINNFSYCGNHAVDLKVWTVSGGAIVVNGSDKLKNDVNNISQVIKVFDSSGNKFLLHMKALRLHQWIKNILIFVPLLAAHMLTNLECLYQSLIAFFAFGLCASSAYLLNDLLDLESDRLHPTKLKRPFASGGGVIANWIFFIPIAFYH